MNHRHPVASSSRFRGRQHGGIVRHWLAAALLASMVLTAPALADGEAAQTITVVVKTPWPADMAQVRLEDVGVRLIARRTAVLSDAADEVPLKVLTVQPIRTGSGTASARFKVTAEVPAGLDRSQYRLTAYIDAGNTVTESTGGAVDLTVSFTNVTLPGAIVAGGRGVARFTLSITNKGDVTTAKRQYVDVRVVARPADALDDSKDVLLTNEPNESVGGLAPGESVRSVLIAEFPGPLEVGSYTLRAVVDSRNDVQESDEQNNMATLPDTISVTPSNVDLLIDLAGVELPKGVVAGVARTIKVPVKITNAGNLPFDPDQRTDVHVVARPASKAMDDSADVVLGRAGSVALADLGPGRSQVVEVEATLPASLSVDNYILRAIVDPLERVKEANESNNTAMLLEPIQVLASVVDLSIELVNAQSPDRVIAGATPRLVLPVKMKNAGTLGYAGDATVDMKVLLRPVDAKDTRRDVVLRSTEGVSLSALTPGTEQMLSLDTFIPADLDVGQYRLLVTATPRGDIKESDTTNNVAEVAQQIAVEAPFVDLTPKLVALVPPRAIVSGSAVEVAAPVQVTNLGNVPVPDGRSIDVRITARVADKLDDTGHDVPLTVMNNQDVGGLAAGDTRTFAAKVRFPAGTAEGQYVLVAAIDTGNAVSESNETNNVVLTPAAQAIRVVAPVQDLAVDLVNLQLPGAVVAGTSTQLAAPVKVINQGNVPTAKEQRLQINLALAPMDGDDGGGDRAVALTSLSNQDVSGLAPGESRIFEAAFTIGATVGAGRYRLAATIDPAGLLQDANRRNNMVVTAATQAIAVAAPFIDMAAELSDLRLPSSVVAGYGPNASVQVTVNHLGNVPVPADRKIDIRLLARPAEAGDDGKAKDTLLTTLTGLDISGMSPSEAKVFRADLLMPAAMDAGRYRLVAWVDPTGIIADSQAANNIAVSLPTQVVTVVRPYVDLAAELVEPNLPATVVAGHGPDASLQVQVTQLGNIPVAADRKVDIQLLARPADAAADDAAKDVVLATLSAQDIGGLAPSASRVFRSDVSLPANMPAGRYRLAAWVDPAGVITDPQPANNRAMTPATQAINVVKPYVDLMAELVQPNLPATVVAGHGPDAALQVKVTQLGNIAIAADRTIDIRLIARPVEAGDDDASKDVLLATLSARDVGGLAPSASRVFRGQVLMPASTPAGRYRLGAWADPANVVGDRDPVNNRVMVSANQAVTVATPRVDLAAELVNASVPARMVAGVGPAASLTVQLTNLGNVPVDRDRAVDIKLLARPAGAADAGKDVVLATVAGQSVSGLAPGQSRSVTQALVLPTTLPAGKYVLAAVVDEAGVVQDADRGNNTVVTDSAKALELVQPFVDLAAAIAMEQVANEVVAEQGNPVPVTLTLSQTGNAPIASGQTVQVEVLARPVSGGDAVVLVSHGAVDVGGMGPGAVQRLLESVRFPSSLVNGKYVLGVRVDGASRLSESDETNNTAWLAPELALSVVPARIDLAATLDVVRPNASMVTGTQTVDTHIRLVNRGNVAIPADQKMDIELLTRPASMGRNPARDKVLAKLADQAIGGLAPGQTRSLSGQVTFDAGKLPADDYVLLARIDSSNVVAEADETNNDAIDVQRVIAVGDRPRIRNLPVPFESDGPQRYAVNGLQIDVSAAGVPPLEQLRQLRVPLTRSYAGYVAQRINENVEKPLIAEIQAMGDIYLYRSAVRAICDRLRDHLEDTGLRNVRVRPAPDQISDGGEDLRPGGKGSLRIVIE